MNFICVADLKDYLLKNNAGAEIPSDWDIKPEQCPQGMEGDITVNCFRLAGILKQKPDKTADTAVDFLKNHPDVLKAEKIKAFVNITLKAEALFRDSISDISALLNSAELPVEKRRRVLIEYSAPNTNKPQHLGHVRNNTLGMSLVSLMKRIGNDVIPINLVNDRGIHICKSMIAYQRFSSGETPQSSGIKGDHLVGKYYVRFNEELNVQLRELKKEKPELAVKDDEELFLLTEIGAATQKMLQDWEAGVPEVIALWKKMNGWVFEGFDETYRRLGVKFAHTYLESKTYLSGKEFVSEGFDKGIFFKRENGAIAVDLDKLGEKVLLRSDGTSVYITQDIGTTVKKYEDYKPEVQVWVVGDEQVLHFKMLFAILKKMGYQWADNLHHLAYGMVNLPTGKMKSREGTVVDADDLFEEMCRLAKEATLERCEGNIPEDIDRRSEIIGMGALKFMLLKFNPKTTIMFDPQASLKFEGDTGPYVQYACARINSIERKGRERGIISENSQDIRWELLNTKEEKNLGVALFLYPGILQSAAEKLDCSLLVSYLIELAKLFSRFYRECPVLNAEDKEIVKARLALCCRCRDVLADGLKTLTIDVPDAM